MYKVCSKCKLNKDFNSYYKDSRVKKDGLQVHCKECFKEQHKLYRKSQRFKRWNSAYRSHPNYKDKTKERNNPDFLLPHSVIDIPPPPPDED